MAGYDPALMAQARAAMGYAPLDAQPTLEQAQASAGLFPQAVEAPSLFEQAMGAGAAQPVPFSMLPADQGQMVMEQPPAALPVQQQPEFVPRPAQEMGAVEPQARAAQPARAPTRASSPRAGAAGGGGVSNPLPGMLNDASARRGAADSARTSAGIDADMALEGQALSQEQLGASRQRTAGATVNNLRDAAQVEADTQQRLDAEYDSHLKATDRVAARKREVDDYIGNYQVKDRRSIDKKAMGALAVFAASMQDQQNMIAGMSMGQPVVTNRGADMAALIGRQVDRDLEMQREMLSNKRTQAAALGTELGQAYQRWGDTKESLLTARQLKLDQYEKGLEAIKAQGTSEEAGILADQAIEALRMQKAQIDEERARGDYDKAFGDEQRLKQAQYAQAMASRPRVMSAKEALELEGKALDNAGKRQALEQGPNGKPLTAEQLKRQSLFQGKDQAANTIARLVASGESAPGMLGRNVPTLLRTASGDEVDTAIAAMKDVLLRDESGASISEGDKASKVDAWGLERGEAARKNGLRMMLDEYNARRESVGLPAVNAIVRKGAAG